MTRNNSTIIDCLALMVSWRRLIVVNFMIFTVVTATFSLIMPKTFSVTTTLLAPASDNDGFGLAGLIGAMPFSGLDLGGLSGQTNMFMAILNSRTVMETIASRFNLMSVYKTDNMEETVRILREQVSTAINDDGTISISVSAQTGFFAYSEAGKKAARVLAPDMANAFVQELDRENKHLKTEKAHNNRLFVEKRYFQNIADLRSGEEALKTFQNKHKILALPEQTEQAIHAASELRALIISKEVQVEVLRNYLSGSHAELKRAEGELRALNEKLVEMKRGKPESTNSRHDSNDVTLFIPLNQTPEIGLQYIRLLREVKLQQKIQEFLLPQYEQAKIQEAKDTPTVQILDEAVIPIRRTSPKRTLMVLFGGFLSLIISACLILIFEYVNRIRREGGAEYEKLRGTLAIVRGRDIPRRK